MKEPQTKEHQYQFLVEQYREQPSRFGLMSSEVWRQDPRRLCFVLARYKFVAKMLSGVGRVLEIGCADAFGSRVVKQEVTELTVTDFDPIFIDNAKSTMDPKWPLIAEIHDMAQGPLSRDFDAAYALDVLEHIDKRDEHRFLSNITQSIGPHGVVLLGTPSVQSQAYASAVSKEGHVNCKDGQELKTLMQRYFANVFLFCMNDEVVHTGFSPMAHYLFALCGGKR